MKQAEVFTLILKAVHALSKKHFQTLSVLLVWQSSLQTEPVIRYRKDTVCLLAYLEFKVETLCRVKRSRIPFRVCTVCYLSSPFEWREIHCKPHSWTVICISQEGKKEMDWQGEKGKGKGIMEIESERRRVGLHFVSRDDSGERTELQRRVKAGFKRPHSCRRLCWCARKLLSLKESETPVQWWASRMSCFLSASCFFSSPLIHGSTRPSKMATVQRLLEKTTSPSLEWPVEMTAAFVGVSSSSQYIFHMAFKAITFVTRCKPGIVDLLAARNVGRFTSSKKDYYSVQTVETVLNHKEDAKKAHKETQCFAGPAI